MVRLGRRQADHHRNRYTARADHLPAGQLHTAYPCGNPDRRAGKSSPSHAGGETPAGGERHLPAGTGGDGG